MATLFFFFFFYLQTSKNYQAIKKNPTFFQKNKQAILKQTNTVITNLYYVFFRETPSLSAIIILCVQKKVLATLAPGYTV